MNIVFKYLINAGKCFISVVLPSLSSPNTPVVVQNSAPPGHHRTNSAPQPPPPPPPAPAMPTGGGGGAGPPPPPPMPNGPLSRSGDAEVGSLAAALASAHLRKASRPQPDAISTTSTSSSSSSGSTSSGSLYGTLRGNRSMTNGGGGGDAPAGGSTSLMDEMAKTLARRRAMVKENSAPNVPALQSNNNSTSNIHNNSQVSSLAKVMEMRIIDICEDTFYFMHCLFCDRMRMISQLQGK